MKDGKTRPNHVFREFFLKQFDAMWGKVSALDALKISKPYKLFDSSKFCLGHQSAEIELLNCP